MISIILPFKNEESFLKETLDSIIDQTETDFEVLLIDDHSDDLSGNIANTYTRSDQRFKYFLNKGTGVIDALQTGFNQAKGDFLTRQDGDDLMPKEKLRILKENLLKSGKGTVSTGKVSYFSKEKLGQGFKDYEKWLNTLCDQKNHWQQIYKECVIASSNWLMYKEDFNSLNYFSQIIHPEDYYLTFKIFEQKMKIVCSKKVTHLWRDHPDRASRTSELYQDQNFFPLKVFFFLKLESCENIIIWGAGPNGKQLVQQFQKEGIELTWVTNNNRKIGKNIYGIPIQDPTDLKFNSHHKLIICIRQPGAIQDIRNYLSHLQSSPLIFEF